MDYEAELHLVHREFAEELTFCLSNVRRLVDWGYRTTEYGRVTRTGSRVIPEASMCLHLAMYWKMRILSMQYLLPAEGYQREWRRVCSEAGDMVQRLHETVWPAGQQLLTVEGL